MLHSLSPPPSDHPLVALAKCNQKPEDEKALLMQFTGHVTLPGLRAGEKGSDRSGGTNERYPAQPARTILR